MMKKIKRKLTFFMCMIAFAVMCIQGCGKTETKDDTSESQVENAPLEGLTEENISLDSNTEMSGNGQSIGDTQTTDTEEAVTSQLQLGNALEIPRGFKKLDAENQPNEALEKAIREYYKMTEGVYNDIGYYYNYVDLNGDSQNEILSLVFHIEKEVDEGIEIDEEKLLWMDISDSNLTERAVLQEFDDVDMPIFISYHMTEGYRDLIFRDDSDEYVICIWNKDSYQNEQEGKELPNIDGYEGETLFSGDANYHILEAGEGE